MQFNSLLLRHRYYFMCSMGRHISTTTGLHSQSKNNFVRKFLINTNESKKRKRWHQSKVTMMANPTELAQHQVKGEASSHRLHVLNKVFMDCICDMLSTGEVSSLFTGYGLEISKVQVLPGMTGINVHWFCTGLDVDNKLEQILLENAYALRHEISQLRIIGRVPPITFVKDHRYYRLMEVERRLAKADFGEDFEPTDPTHEVKASLVLREELDESIKSAVTVTHENGEETSDFLQALKIASSVSDENDEPMLNNLPLDLPQMRDDILGVNTGKIYHIVKQGMSRAQAEHRKNREGAPACSTLSIHSEHDTSIPHPVSSRTEEIRQWASKYEQLRRKERRTKNKEQELLSLPRVYVEDDFDELEYDEEDDFLEENFDQEEKPI